jgi:hypothetical protein
MTSPNTEHNPSTLGGPPQYPTSQMVPPEFWRKENSTGPGGEDHGQYLTVDYGDGQVHKRAVEPGWDHPVYVGPREDDPALEDEG